VVVLPTGKKKKERKKERKGGEKKKKRKEKRKKSPPTRAEPQYAGGGGLPERGLETLPCQKFGIQGFSHCWAGPALWVPSCNTSWQACSSRPASLVCKPLPVLLAFSSSGPGGWASTNSGLLASPLRVSHPAPSRTWSLVRPATPFGCGRGRGRGLLVFGATVARPQGQTGVV
jgi:hypothetical protein